MSEQQIKANRKALLESIGRHEDTQPYHSPMVMTCAEYTTDIDHHELYAASTGQTVLVCSNYGNEPPSVLGMFEILPIYNDRARSFCAVFDNRHAYRRAMYQLRRERK